MKMGIISLKELPMNIRSLVRSE